MAVQYLFPSGLTDPKATPVFKPPEEIFPKFKKMEFDSECRPKDPLFYTTQPRFYHLLSVGLVVYYFLFATFSCKKVENFQI